MNSLATVSPWFDWTISFGNVITLITLAIAAVSFIYTMRSRIDSMSSRMSFIEVELRKLVQVLIDQGKHEERMTAIDDRVLAQGQRLDALTDRVNKRFDAHSHE